MRRLLLAPILFLAACGQGSGARGTAVEYYLNADPPSLDPAVSTNVQFDADAQLRPGNLSVVDGDRPRLRQPSDRVDPDRHDLLVARRGTLGPHGDRQAVTSPRYRGAFSS